MWGAEEKRGHRTCLETIRASNRLPWEVVRDPGLGVMQAGGREPPVRATARRFLCDKGVLARRSENTFFEHLVWAKNSAWGFT